jgi:hypothetical protein
MSDDVVETKMFPIFQLVNDWLKFAEAKNLAILALSGAACSAVISFLVSSQAGSPNVKKILLLSISLFTLSCLTSLLSFTPRTNERGLRTLFIDWGTPGDNDNLYFFRDLGKYEMQNLARRYQQMFAPASPPDAALSLASTQLASQIIVNSRIVVYKLRFFLVAMLLFVLAVAIIVITLIYNAIVS